MFFHGRNDQRGFELFRILLLADKLALSPVEKAENHRIILYRQERDFFP
jgi:hypothetical protein